MWWPDGWHGANEKPQSSAATNYPFGVPSTPHQRSNPDYDHHVSGSILPANIVMPSMVLHDRTYVTCLQKDPADSVSRSDRQPEHQPKHEAMSSLNPLLTDSADSLYVGMSPSCCRISFSLSEK
jgi:hypothetical protein